MAFIEHIMVCTDFSDTAEIALQQARQITVALGAKLTLLHVLSPLAEAELADKFGSPDMARDECLEIGKHVHEALKELKSSHFGEVEDLHVEMLSESDATDAILTYAKTHGVDLVVMGSHGRTGLSHLLMGSVAEKVARHAPCSVLIARPST